MSAQSDDENRPSHAAAAHGPEGRGRTDLRGLFTIYLKGIAMGSADIVPGVSGGTMALILGIYERLIHSLRSLVRWPFLGAMRQGQFRRAFGTVDGAFLLALVAGIFTAVVALSNLLSGLLENRPVFVYAFFFGLIFASVFLVGRRIRELTLSRWLLFAAGTVGAFLLVGLTPAQTPQAGWFLFLSGAIAISALLLPGISGAFILVLLGKYDYVLGAVSEGDLAALTFVAAGAVVGILSFAQILGWLFRRFHDSTLAVLAGVMLGSLRKVWPWQTEVEGLQVNLAPPLGSWADAWSSEYGVAWAVLLAVTGAVLVTVLDRVSEGSEEPARAS